MALDEQLRDQLTRSADAFQPDTGSRLTHVMRTAHNRRRRQRVVTTVLAVAVIAAIAVVLPRIDLNNLRGLPANTKHTKAPHRPASSIAEHHPQLHIPLTGDWKSNVIPSRRVRSAITAAGINSAAATRLLGQASTWRTHMTFGWGGGYVVQVAAWDPSGGAPEPSPGDQYWYRTHASHELVLKKVPGGSVGSTAEHASATRLFFTYRIRDQRLYLHFNGAKPAISAAATAALVAWTTAPLRRMTY